MSYYYNRPSTQKAKGIMNALDSFVNYYESLGNFFEVEPHRLIKTEEDIEDLSSAKCFARPCPLKILSPRIRETELLPINSSPIRNACAKPSGLGWTA